jgi:hypothetical protein
VELLSSAGEELGPGPAEDMFLRESANKKKRGPYSTVRFQPGANAKYRGSNHSSFLSSRVHAPALHFQR